MNLKLPVPEDFIKNFSPRQEADLVLWVVDEAPRPSKGLPSLLRRFWNFLHENISTANDLNDIEAERAWLSIVERWKEITPASIALFLTERYSQSDHLRKFEYAFLANCLARTDVTKDVIVDMGGGNSYSTVVSMLFRFPDVQIFSVDVMNHPRASRYNVHYIRGDCMNTNLPDQSADIVTIISTLEHVGLGRWGDPLDVNGDINAMREAFRILKPGGHVVLTIPYGYPTVVYNLHRVYDSGRVDILTEGFEVIQAEYSLLGSSAKREEIEGVRLVREVPGFRTTLPPRHGITVSDIPGGGMFLLRKSSHKHSG